MAQNAPAWSKINTNPTQVAPAKASRDSSGRVKKRMAGDARGSSRDPGRVVVEVGWEVVVYPPEVAGGLWRAVFTEGGARRFRQGRTEAELAVKLEKVIERLAAGTANMEPDFYQTSAHLVHTASGSCAM